MIRISGGPNGHFDFLLGKLFGALDKRSERIQLVEAVHQASQRLLSNPNLRVIGRPQWAAQTSNLIVTGCSSLVMGLGFVHLGCGSFGCSGGCVELIFAVHRAVEIQAVSGRHCGRVSPYVIGGPETLIDFRAVRTDTEDRRGRFETKSHAEAVG